MRLIFMGTPDFAATALRTLITSEHDVVCVYSQPPRPAGRGYALKKSPVHLLAEQYGIDVRTPVSLKSSDEQTKFSALHADAAVVVAYGLLLPKPVLEAPKFGCFNIHASVLPRWRGAAPIQRAIMAGDAETGVTIMRMDEGLDTGPMMKVVKCPIAAAETAASLHDELARIGAAAMVDVLKNPDGRATPQPSSGVTYASKIDKSEARIDFGKPAVDVRSHIHGLSPFPGAWTIINGSRVKVLQARVSAKQGVPSTFLDDKLTIACGDGALELLELQREGKGAMSAETFLRGFNVAAGTRAA